MDTKTKVIIAGAGIAGPVLAIFLKMKGYEPIIYERADQSHVAGNSLCLQPNGLRVLALIPGLIDKIVGKQLEKIIHCSIVPEDDRVLVDVDVASLASLTGFPLIGVERLTFNRTLIGVAESYGVKVVWGHQLVSFKDDGEVVEVTFANGATDTASFVIGCDGLHSNTRICLFGQEPVSFTGLTQTGGVSPTPEVMRQHAAMHWQDVYRDGAFLLVCPISDTHSSWSVTLREAEAKETWRSMDEQRKKEFKEGPYSQLPHGLGEMIKSSERIIKYGLYDRPELSAWHKGRVALVGDAAHPTSPHLGQGANQAFEDIYHLVRLLVQHNPSAQSPSTAVLSSVFTEYESLRIPRTAGLVKQARQQGDNRVVDGIDACKKRNHLVCHTWESKENMTSVVNNMYMHPFTAQPEI